MESGRINRALKKSLINAGIEKHVKVHELRHTAASLAFLKGIPGKVVQELLGHSNLNTTQMYLSVTVAHLKEAISLLD